MNTFGFQASALRGRGLAPWRHSDLAYLLSETTMSNPHLPQEIADYIIDLLGNEPRTLKRCCLVSRSWVPPARKHLFGTIEFGSLAHLVAWRKAFPNPLNSPIHFVSCLNIDYTNVIAAVSKDCCWVQLSFSNVVRLTIWASRTGLHSRSPLRSLTILKSLHRFRNPGTLATF